MRRDQILAERLKRRREQGLYRSLEVVTDRQGVEVVVKGQKLINFSSNDYLGMASHPQVIAAMKRGADRYGIGSGASHLVSGHFQSHAELEQELAEFVGYERTLLFSTGYQANLGVLTALSSRNDWVFEDRLNHASLLDGVRLAGANLKRYPHGDVSALKSLVEEQPQACLLATDGVFSMDGDLAPLPEMADLARCRDLWLYVDDAHGFGVLGKEGAGSISHFGLGPKHVPIVMATFGKALGVFGAFVAGSELLIETLIQQARTFIYTTALPPALTEAVRMSLALMQRENWRREKLTDLIARFRRGASALGLNLIDSSTPIQPLIVGDSLRALEVSRSLQAKGFWLSAIRPPTVPVGTARLRITLSAAHSETQVDRLLEALSQSL